MNKSHLFLSLILLLSSCKYAQRTFEYQFQAAELPTEEFYYTALNVPGRAYGYFVCHGGVIVSESDFIDGMITDAKRDLMQKHPLGQSESFVNWNIDVIRTVNGVQRQIRKSTEKIEYHIVVSADVIRLGRMPDGFRPNVFDDQISSETDKSGETGLIALETSAGSGAAVPMAETVFQTGNVVTFSLNGITLEGKIISESSNVYPVRYRVEYSRNGKAYFRELYAKDMQLKQ